MGTHFVEMKILFTLCSFLIPLFSFATDRWTLQADGSIQWNVGADLPHNDHIEMAGKQMAVVLRYGVQADKSFTIEKRMVWPMLRMQPNQTHNSLMETFPWDVLREVRIDDAPMGREEVERLTLRGLLRVESRLIDKPLKLVREYLPSTARPALVESYTLINEGAQPVTIEIPQVALVQYTDSAESVYGAYSLERRTDRAGRFEVAGGESLRFAAEILGRRGDQTWPPLNIDHELAARTALVNEWLGNLVLETPDEVINRMFAFSKIRASESIFETAGGPMHGPGGESYYAAIWANDQAEYVNPFFPFEGYVYGNASALNSYLHFARFQNKEYKAVPSSIIAEGKDIWNGVGDRGDAAMIAYGAQRYVMARGSLEEARVLWPFIKWCLEYTHRQLNAAGVPQSDTDELENRFPSGNANLCTASLYYDALVSASYLAPEMGESKQVAKQYASQAAQLRKNMEKYFGATVEGFPTYRYYEGNDVLRAWICIPLVMGIDERAQGTIDALFSPRLWTDNGLLSQAGSETYWDRSTLYALRGVFTAGYPDRALNFLQHYSRTRLLGEHVPYAIEAWPEGNQRHLSAESGLYARIFTEGVLGIRPTGLRSCTVTPHLPKAWDKVALRHIRAFGGDFDIEVAREGNKLRVNVRQGAQAQTYRIKEGGHITLDKKLFNN